jgi:hypothetical protein
MEAVYMAGRKFWLRSKAPLIPICRILLAKLVSSPKISIKSHNNHSDETMQKVFASFGSTDLNNI